MRAADTIRASVSSDRHPDSAKSITLCKGPNVPVLGAAAFPEPLETSPSFLQTTSYHALLLDDDAAHAEQLIERVQPQSLAVERVRIPQEALAKLQRNTDCYELIIINVSGNSWPWDKTLQKLQHACQRLNGHPAPLFLCVSKTRKNPDFILRIERLGARYVFER